MTTPTSWPDHSKIACYGPGDVSIILAYYRILYSLRLLRRADLVPACDVIPELFFREGNYIQCIWLYAIERLQLRHEITSRLFPYGKKSRKCRGNNGTTDAYSDYYYKPDAKLKAQHLEKLLSSSRKIHMLRRRSSSTQMYFGCFLFSTFITLILSLLLCSAENRHIQL